MTKSKKKSYKEIHGTTRVGDFLRSINFSKLADVVGNVTTGNIKGVIEVLKDSSSEITEEQRNFALSLLEQDIEENKEVSKRWTADMASDSWLSKNIRPLSLAFLTFTTIGLIYIDFFNNELSVPTEWIDLLKSLLLGVYIAYFGSRGVEKFNSIKKGSF